MRTIGGYPFPETRDESLTWQGSVRYRALSCRVLAVRVTRCEGAWAAYCDSVPGESHGNEIYAVLENGDKLPEDVARVLFPEMAEIPWAE